MKISARFAEFGMTGALFWIMQLAYVTIVHDTEIVDSLQPFIDSLKGYKGLWDKAPSEIKNVGGNLLTAVGLIGIFVTGLFLYLLGSYFFILENRHFIKQLKRNSSWMDDMMKSCTGTVSEDYQQICNKSGVKFFFFDSVKKLHWRWQLSRQCKNVQSFLFSFIQVFCKNGSSEILSDNVHVWRISRAIGIIFFVLCLQILLLDFHGRGIVQFGSAAAFLFLAIYTTLRSYDRLCYTLFSMACATHHSRQKTDSPNSAQ